MADDTDAGLPVRQLLKMVASGDLSLAEFKKLTRHVMGCDEEVPIDVTAATTSRMRSPRRRSWAPQPQLPHADAVADTPTALEPGDGQADEDDDAAGEEVGGGGDDNDDAEEAAAAALPWDESESEAEAEAEEVDEQPPAKRHRRASSTAA